jgi:hypothetical protein
MRSETSFSLKGSVGVGFGFGASMLLAGFFVIHSFSTQKLKKARDAFEFLACRACTDFASLSKRAYSFLVKRSQRCCSSAREVFNSLNKAAILPECTVTEVPALAIPDEHVERVCDRFAFRLFFWLFTFFKLSDFCFGAFPVGRLETLLVGLAFERPLCPELASALPASTVALLRAFRFVAAVNGEH